MTRFLLLTLVFLVSACALVDRDRMEARQAGPDQLRPQARGGDDTARPSEMARTAEDFDTTSAEQRADATAGSGGGALLGTTVASLGAVTEPGFWLKTPLVQSPAPGRIELPGRGTFVNVDLIPLDGPRSAGSQISLGAMRLLNVPLTELPEISVYRR
jgi:hypothetical protein